jgi:hypothetical protein
LTSTYSNYYAELKLGTHTLTNTGTVNFETGTGGERYIEGNLINNHVASVSAGTALYVQGAYTQGTAGTLKMGVASSSHATLTASGVAKLAGGLQLVQSGFAGKAGDQLTIITGSTRNLDFAHVSGATINPSLYYRAVYFATTVALEVTAGEPFEKTPVNETRPTVNGTAQQGSTLWTSNGGWSLSPFEYSYQWLRCDASGSGCQPVEGSFGQSYLLTAADAGHRMTVQVTAYNSGGGSAPAEPSSKTAVVSSLPLHAVAGEDISLVEGDSATLDGTGSTPAPEITKYRWQFGDGAEHEGANDATLHHAYATAGKYKATLTVYRGSEQSSDELSVNVAAKPAAGKGAIVTVLDSGKSPVAGATVLYVGSDGQRSEAKSGSAGEATLAGLPAGSDAIYAYKAGFRPEAKTIAIDAQGNGAASVTLEAGEVATSSLKSKELTEEQIIAAGIDPNNPANQNVYEFEVKLAFINGSPEVDLHGYVNSGGEFVGGYGASGGGGGWSCSPSGCEGSGGGGGGDGGPIIAVPEVVEGHPLIQWLILRGKAAVLKQFFEINMVVQNLSTEPPFKLSPGSMTLNLPSGMSLAPTPEPQALSQSVGVIEPKGSASATWIIRGDETGTFSLSAAYHAKLEPFKAPVDVLAGLPDPLRVWGVEALQLNVEADSGFLAEGRPYHVRLGIKNEADVPLYNVHLSIYPDIHANFLFQPGQVFSDRLGEIKAKETTWAAPYTLVPDAASEGPLNTALSSAEFVQTENAPKGKVDQNLTPPPFYTVSAPETTAGKVHLEWQAVPDAEGYEVFSTKDLEKTAFNATNDPAAETATGTLTTAPLPKTATNAYLTDPGETRFYAVSAIVQGRLKLESVVIRAKAPNNAPTVTKLKPVSGPVAGGTSVVITGTNFTNVSAVKFGTTPATSYTVTSSTSIKAIAPASSPAIVDVTVTTASATSALSTKDRYKFTPTVTAVSPTGGSTAGGNTVTVTGTGFALGTKATVIKFGTTAGKSFNCTSSTTCTVVAPAHAAGKVDVKATVNKVASPKSIPADQYTYS